jgi:hypothetical protein
MLQKTIIGKMRIEEEMREEMCEEVAVEFLVGAEC